LRIAIEVPASAKLSAEDRTRLENAARHCPVHQSLHPDVAMPIEFVYR
jgi:putative redox protein